MKYYKIIEYLLNEMFKLKLLQDNNTQNNLEED